jgi:hypothetical protein
MAAGSSIPSNPIESLRGIRAVRGATSCEQEGSEAAHKVRYYLKDTAIANQVEDGAGSVPLPRNEDH